MNLLDALRYLTALEQHRHFGRAAQACHITQPALSNALRALEADMLAYGASVQRELLLGTGGLLLMMVLCMAVIMAVGRQITIAAGVPGLAALGR